MFYIPIAYIQAAETAHHQDCQLAESIAGIAFHQVSVNNAKFSEYGTQSMEFNSHEFRNLPWAGSYVELETNLEIDTKKKYYLNINHCSTTINGQPSSKVTIAVNGKAVLSGYNPMAGGGFIREHFDITSYLRSGANTVRVTLDPDSISRYWIKEFSVLSTM